MDILEGNRLIGTTLFGAEYIDDDPIAYPDGYYWQPNGKNENINLPYLAEDWEFHLSWDWIMPVIEKIGKEYNVKIIRYADECSNVCEIETAEEDPLQITYCYGFDYDGETKIKVVFNAVVEFIEWYNKQKESN